MNSRITGLAALVLGVVFAILTGYFLLQVNSPAQLLLFPLGLATFVCLLTAVIILIPLPDLLTNQNARFTPEHVCKGSWVINNHAGNAMVLKLSAPGQVTQLRGKSWELRGKWHLDNGRLVITIDDHYTYSIFLPKEEGIYRAEQVGDLTRTTVPLHAIHLQDV